MTQANAGDDGWLSALLEDGTEVHVRVGWSGGFGPDAHMVVTDVLIRAQEVTTDTLRSTHPMRLIAGVVHIEGESEIAQAARSGTIAPQMLVSAIAQDPKDDDDLTLGQLRDRAIAQRKTKPRRPLGRPEGDPTFYARVAVAYRSASSESGRPALTLAEENDVPPNTVRRWIQEARRRGHLEPGRKGRAL
jgi:hypothetical protein